MRAALKLQLRILNNNFKIRIANRNTIGKPPHFSDGFFIITNLRHEIEICEFSFNNIGRLREIDERKVLITALGKI